jgi:hypothetical protein
MHFLLLMCGKFTRVLLAHQIFTFRIHEKYKGKYWFHSKIFEIFEKSRKVLSDLS